jgi:hypothetical protein
VTFITGGSGLNVTGIQCMFKKVQYPSSQTERWVAKSEKIIGDLVACGEKDAMSALISDLIEQTESLKSADTDAMDIVGFFNLLNAGADFVQTIGLGIETGFTTNDVLTF